MIILDDGNSTSERVWHPNVTTRGTWTIYQTCIITIGLCVWQSIHLNVPPPSEKWYKQTIRKLGFAVTALIAPEYVAFIAWSQYCKAMQAVVAVNAARNAPMRPRSWRSCAGSICWLILAPIRWIDHRRMWRHHLESKLQFELEQGYIRRQQAGNTDVDNGAPWTAAMGFYATCGGFIGRREHGTPKAIKGRFLMHLAENEPHLLPHIRHDKVKSISKADSLAKTITCVQALWFCASCIARLKDNKAVTLLELNTFAHCICAFIIYVFWWDKPYDITSHTVVDHELFRYGELLSRCRGSRGYNELRIWDAGTNLKYWRYFGEIRAKSNRSWQTSHDLCIVWLGCDSPSIADSMHCLVDGEMIPGTEFRLSVKKLKVEPPSQLAGITPGINKSGYYLSDEKLALWQDLWSIRQRFMESFPTSSAALFREYEMDDYCKSRIGNVRTEFSFGALSVAGVAFILYGSLHLLAWFYAFASVVEQRLWRVATIATIAFIPGVIGTVLLYFCFELVTTGVAKLFKHKDEQKLKGPFSPAVTASTFLLGLLILSNILARSYLIIESFVALPNSPPSVYEVPSWTTYVPHI